MCHEILKEEEEDDEVTSSDDGGQCHKEIDELLEEQNGNLGEQFTNLNICDNNTTDTRSNGDIDTPEKGNGNNSSNTNNNQLNNKKHNLKQTKKGTNNNNSNTNNSNKLPATDLDANDTNDNKDDCGNNNDEHLAHTNDLINDDVSSVQG